MNMRFRWLSVFDYRRIIILYKMKKQTTLTKMAHSYHQYFWITFSFNIVKRYYKMLFETRGKDSTLRENPIFCLSFIYSKAFSSKRAIPIFLTSHQNTFSNLEKYIFMAKYLILHHNYSQKKKWIMTEVHLLIKYTLFFFDWMPFIIGTKCKTSHFLIR